MATKKYVSRKSDMPNGDHWVIMEFDTVYTPGDERSRTNPGHGYPESYDPVVRYIAFTDEDEWKQEIIRRQNAKGDSREYVAQYVQRATITTTVNVNVGFDKER